MDERMTTVPGESSRQSQPAGRLGGRGRIALTAAIALAVLGASIGLVVVLSHSSSSTTVGPTTPPVAPVALSAGGLATLARAVGQPMYWAGPQKGYLYELTRTANRNIYIRYLPPGVDVGAKGAKYLIVATYPFPGAFEALKKVAAGQGVQIPGGGLAVVDKSYPKSVHMAFPNVDYQVEVFDPSPARALEVATSGRVRPAGR